MPSRRVSLPFLICLALLLPLSCGGREAAPPALPPPFSPAPVTPAPWRYVEPGGRLTFPTDTPVPAATPRPAREPPDLADPSLATDPSRPGTPAGPSAAGGGTSLVDPPPPADLKALSCRDHYRRMLIGYDERVPFGPEAAWRLSGEFREARPDCAARGWAPEFGLERACFSTRVGGLYLSYDFLRREGRLNRATTLPTGRDGAGNILVHFRKLPFRPEPGCWYYAAAQQAWGWLVAGVGGGVDRPVFPLCEDRLRKALSLDESPDLGPLGVARAIDAVRAELPGQCRTPLWDLYPRRAGHEECGVVGDTGRREDGVLVVNWHPEHPASGGALCWVLAGGEWEEFHPAEDE